MMLRSKNGSAAWTLSAVALLVGTTWFQPAGAQSNAAGAAICPDQPEGVPPGIYASAIQDSITLSKGPEQIEVGAGYTGFADDPSLTCLEETPDFIRRDPLPAPGDFSAAGAACGFSDGGDAPAMALTSDWPRMERRFADEIENFVSSGYPTNSIIIHAVSSGLTIDKTLYLMTRADEDRADEFFDAALALQSSLPGWSCSAGGSSRGDSYSRYYHVNDLPPERTIGEVARRYFEENLIMEPFPDWSNGDFHMLAYTDEMVDLAEDTYWYKKPDQNHSQENGLKKPILISLYGDTEEVVLDISRDELLEYQRRGLERLPVVFYFNKDYQRAISDLRNDITLEGLIDSFENEGAEMTPVPYLNGGDHHLVVPIEEFEDFFEIPDRDDIDESRFARLTESIKLDGFSKRPVAVTLFSSENSRWLDDPARIRAAMEAGIEEVPVAMLYHRMQRMPCSSIPTCTRRMCDALTCAGAAPSACLEAPAAGVLGREASDPQDPPPIDDDNPSAS